MTPPPSNLLVRPAGPREPRRGSRDGLGMAPRSPWEAATESRWLEKLARWFLEFFGSQLDPNLGSSWAPLGTPRGPKMQYVLRFLMFLRILFYALQMPKMIPREPQEGLKRPQEEPKGGPQGPKRGPRPPQDGPNTALRRLQDGPSRVPEPPLMFMTAVAAQRNSQEGPGTSPDPPQGPSQGAREGFKRIPC